MNEKQIEALKSAFHGDSFRLNVPMSEYTTFKLGGNAACMLEVTSVSLLQKAVRLCRAQGIAFFVLGNGSNLLVKDGGIDALVIHIGEGFADVRVEGNRITAQSGASLAVLSRTALKAGLTGLEFACGIPGSVGGGMAMNAGAYGGQLSDTVVSATVMNADSAEVYTLTNAQLEMGYRSTRVLSRGEIVLEATFELKSGDTQTIKAAMDDFAARRRDKQPLTYPSAGSTFKRPEGYFAGALIEQAALKGTSVGGAQVSEKHAGFVINTGNATARDVLELIRLVQDKVMQNSGVMLHPEVRIIGEDE